MYLATSICRSIKLYTGKEQRVWDKFRIPLLVYHPSVPRKCIRECIAPRLLSYSGGDRSPPCWLHEYDNSSLAHICPFTHEHLNRQTLIKLPLIHSSPPHRYKLISEIHILPVEGRKVCLRSRMSSLRPGTSQSTFCCMTLKCAHAWLSKTFATFCHFTVWGGKCPLVPTSVHSLLSGHVPLGTYPHPEPLS